MKNVLNDDKVIYEVPGKSKIMNLWDKQVCKIKKGSFTCPLCKEVFTGRSALGSHLKGHCT